jgi:nucleotide-binding universal stress UspA family protein
MPMKNILAPVDFSRVTDAVIEMGAALAESFSCALWVLHVAAPDPDFVGYDVGPQSVRAGVAGKRHEEHRRVQEESARLRARGVNATALLIQGPTVETIVREAERLKADLIVLGSHGHGALYRSLVGSVSEGVLREASCPVLILPDRRPER